MILVKQQLIENIKNGNIIFNGDIDNIGPNSIDVTLSPILRTYQKMLEIKFGENNYLIPKKSFTKYFGKSINTEYYELKEYEYEKFMKFLEKRKYLEDFKLLDLKKQNKIETTYIIKDNVVLLPGLFYLGSTNEICGSEKFVPMYEGRSSTARLGLQSHISAGFGDIGFINKWTLEINVLMPLKIYPNFRIGQVYFYDIKKDIKVELYKGKYCENNEAKESLIYKDFNG